MQRFPTTGCLGRVVAERCLKIWESAWLPIDVVEAFVSETLHRNRSPKCEHW